MKQLAVKFLRYDDSINEEKRRDIENASPDVIYRHAVMLLKNIPNDFLLVLDNIEDLIYNNKSRTREVINDILQQCSCITILMTSRVTLGAL